VASIIRPRPSPYQPGSRDQEIANTLAESLNINDPMSNTLTIPTGTINPTMGHVENDDAALFRAIGPDQPNPPSIGSTDRTMRVPFRWLRPQGGGLPEARRYIYGGYPHRPPGGRNDKLVGNTPLIFTGDRARAEVSRICRDPPQNALKRRSSGT
jgi:hypothetical protein